MVHALTLVRVIAVGWIVWMIVLANDPYTMLLGAY